MNQIQIFQNQEFGAIRTMSNKQGEPMFCAKDVAEALGYDQPHKAIARHVEEDDGMKRTLIRFLVDVTLVANSTNKCNTSG